MLTKTPATSDAIPYFEFSMDGTKSHSRTLFTVKQFCQQHPAFTEGGLRWLLFNRQQNGLQRAIVKVGRRIYIDVEAFFAWIDEQNSASC